MNKTKSKLDIPKFQIETDNRLENLSNEVIASVISTVSFSEWKKAMKKEQLYFPCLKFQNIREDYLEYYYGEGFTPTDACNDIISGM